MTAEQEAPPAVAQPAKPPVYLTTAQVAERLTITEGMVYRLCAQGRLGHVRFGDRKAMRVTEEQLQEFITRSTKPAVKPPRKPRN